MFGAAVIGELQRRLPLLGFSPIAVDAVSGFTEVAESAGNAPVVIPSDLPEADWREVRNAIGAERDLVVFGPRPSDGARAAMRGAGMRLALWTPVRDAALQFLLSQTGESARVPRKHPRVPTELSAIVYAPAGMRTAGVHELSAGGAFLSTMRPLMRGANFEIEVRLPEDSVRTGCRVVWSNVIGTERKDRHPTGMAVEFTDADEAVRTAVSAFVERELENYTV